MTYLHYATVTVLYMHKALIKHKHEKFEGMRIRECVT